MNRLRLTYAIILPLLLGCQEKKSFTLPAPDADNGGLVLPAGFNALVVVDSVGPTRHLAVNENGDLYVKLRVIDGTLGNVALRDTTGDGKADLSVRWGNYPNDGSFATGMRIHDGYLYFSSERVIYRQRLDPSSLVPPGNPEVILRDHHPIQWHNAKSLAFDKEGGMYVTFSAPTNVCEDWTTISGKETFGVKGYYPCPQLFDQGGIWRFDAGRVNQLQSDGKRYATGLRSIVAMAWNDEDNTLYAVQHGRDYLYGHDTVNFTPWQNTVLPAEEFMQVKEGDDFGWPYGYFDHYQGKRMLAPEYGGDGKKTAGGYANPLMGLPAHWAPNDLLFYRGEQFPARYRNGAFVAFHGSTNRNPYPQGGYVVAFIPFSEGKPTGKWEVFADGFAGRDTLRTMEEASFRPMGLSEGPDGSLYISESKKGRIWRIMFTGDRTQFGNAALEAMEARKSRTYLRDPDPEQDLLKTKP